MANDLTSNPRIVDVVVTSGAAVTVISKPTEVILVQWVNLGTAEIADGSDLSLTVNSATFAIKAAAVGEVP